MKKVIGMSLTLLLASVILGVMALPALGAINEGGVIVGEGDANDCVGGSCGGVIVEDPEGAGPNCDGGNCGGSVCAGPDCGSCEGGNCGGSISGEAKPEKKVEKKEVEKARQLPRTGWTLPTASTLALGAGLLLVGAFYVFIAHPSTKLAWSMLSYRPRRRL